MIDFNGRQKILDDRKNRGLASAMKDAVVSAVASSNSGGNANEEVLKLIVKQESADNTKELGSLQDITRGLINLLVAVKNIKLEFPSIQRVTGTVDANISTLPDINVKNLNTLAPYFTQLGEQVSKISMALALSSKSTPTVKVNSSIDKELFKPLEDSLSAIKDQLSIPNNKDLVDAMGRVEDAITILVNRPQMTPQPVTNVNINALAGVGLTSLVTVGGTAVPLPATPVANRRSMIIFNNDATNIVYIGGPNVTTANGLPILPQSFSPSIDAGNNMIIYAISGGSVDVRVMEISTDAMGR